MDPEERSVMAKFALGVVIFFVSLVGGMLLFSMNGYLELAIMWAACFEAFVFVGPVVLAKRNAQGT